MTTRHIRKRKLIKPGLQLRFCGIFAGLITLIVLLQFAFLSSELHETANALPNDSALLLGEANRITVSFAIASAVVFLPLTVLVGVLSTFRVAGPLYRIERFLRDVEEGRTPSDFALRRGDELHDLARLLNDATRPLRESGQADAPRAGSDRRAA